MNKSSTLCCCRALDFIQGRRVFQGGCVAEFFTQIGGAHNAAHYFRVPCFWYISYKDHIARCKRFAEIARDVLFQFGCQGDVAIRVLLQDTKANQRLTLDRIRHADGCGFANLRVTSEMEAGISDHVWSLDEVITLLDFSLTFLRQIT